MPKNRAGGTPLASRGPKEFYTAVGPSWGWAQNTPFKRYKQWVNEGGISTPMIAHWPKSIAPGSRSNGVGHVIDLASTCADLAGIDWPSQYEGRGVQPPEGLSLLPVLQGDDADRHKELFWEWSGNKAIRRGDLKCVYDKLEKRWALYDVAVDRTETTDLSAERESLALDLQAAWNQWGKQTGVVKRKQVSNKKQ